MYDDPALFERVQMAFAPYENIVCLRYTQDPEESLAALSKRHDLPEELYFHLNRTFIQSPCNGMLARHTVDTKGKTAEQVTDEVQAML